MQGELLPAVVEPQVGERDVADDRIHGRQLRVLEVLDADVRVGVQCLRDPPGERIPLDTEIPLASAA